MTHFSSDILSELITTRISHDLIGNIGAVSNAVELLEEDDSLADVKPILQTSAFTLSARLKFFRLAFGLSNAAPQTINDVAQIASNYLQTLGGRNNVLTLDFKAQTPALYKMILLSLMTLADVFIRGGRLSVQEKDNALFVNAYSESALSESKLVLLQNILEGKIPEDNPALAAPLAYMSALLEVAGVQLSLRFSEKSAEIKIG